jgi:hypothetical protein
MELYLNYLVVVWMTAVPVVILLPFVGIPLLHVHVVSVCFVLPPDVAVVLGCGLGRGFGRG